MQKTINKYPLDLTGKNPNNAIVGEPHSLNTSTVGPNRVFVPLHGGFYTADIKVYDGNGTVLIPNVDYVASYLYEEATLRSGLEVCGTIIVNNPNINDQVYFDYQVVGGLYAVSTFALDQVITSLQDDVRPVQWGKIIGKPDTYPAAGHRHALWELYGFEYVVIELERIVQAIVAGYQPSLDEVREYARTLFSEANDITAVVDGKLTDHENDKTNPHSVTKAQAGLGVVENFPPANTAEANAGTRADRYMTPNVTRDAIATQAGIPLNQHVADKTNPHNVTKAQAGLGVVENFPPANKTEAEIGIRVDRYMTPGVTKNAIDVQAGALLRQHVDDKTNPHKVTKSQVGLGNVENYYVASEVEARAGSRSDRYMTPLRTADAIETQAGTMLRQHVNDKSNPHSVTKAQAGLSQVENYSVASDAEARDGTRSDRYMTPLRTAQAITTQAGSLLRQHVDDKTNPHSVSKAQVGLSLVQNYRISTYNESREMTSATAYVVPAGLRAALDRHVELGEHDSRYVRKNVVDNTSLRVSGGKLQAVVDGSWRTIWPAQWV